METRQLADWCMVKGGQMISLLVAAVELGQMELVGGWGCRP